MTLRYTLLFTLLFILLAFANRYDHWMELPPASIHQWRQADGAATAWHYEQTPAFGEARICNLFQAGDDHAVGELPVLYWLAGWMSRGLGFPAQPLRWIGLVLLFGGGWAFGWILLQRTWRPFVAALGAGLLLSSPILGYYGPSFLPDAPAFCFLLVMGACMVRAGQGRPGWWLAVAAVAAGLAMLLKMSMGIVPMALAGTLAWNGWSREWPRTVLWGGLKPFGAIVAVTVLVVAGRTWIGWYNAAHHAGYFLASTRPIWRYGWSFIEETVVLAGKMALPVFGSAGLYVAILVGGWLIWKNRHRMSLSDRRLGALAVLGSLAYVLLWFRMFREHDYYLICLLALPALLLVIAGPLAVEWFGGRRLVVGLLVCWLLGVWHSREVMSWRLALAFHPDGPGTLPVGAFLPNGGLEEGVVPKSARVICPEDPSPNTALLALGRHGWSAYNFADRVNVDTLIKYKTHFGLTHLALRDTSLYSPLYRAFFPKRVFSGRGWYVYVGQ